MRGLLGATAVTLLAGAAIIAATGGTGEASDHDDGESDVKARALNLTDHFAFVSTDPATPDDLSMVMYFNPRSLPGKEYFLSTNARYELHVSKVAGKTDAPTGTDDFVFRFEAGPPDASGVQPITLTVLENGEVIGTSTGATTSYAKSKAGQLTTNTGAVAGGGDTFHVKYFVGARADAFHFDVIRFFQVRAFLADRFFGGAGGTGNAGASLPANCKGQPFLGGILGGDEGDGDNVNLFNPPSCAQDFTHNYNVLAIVLNVPIADLGGGPVFDTWSTVSVAE